MKGYTRRVFRWVIPVDDQSHKIGGGPVVMTDTRGTVDVVEVWTVEVIDDRTLMSLHPECLARVYGTGHSVPFSSEHLGSAVTPDNQFVWHVFKVMA